MGFLPRSFGRLVLSLTLLTGLIGTILPAPAQAQFTPPDRGLPGRREGGGTRGNGCTTSDRPLIALAPQFVVDGVLSIYGTTVTETPTLYWYVPEVSAEALELVLLDEEGNEVYVATLPANTTSGIVGVEVPLKDNGDSHLSPNQDYRWFFSIVCDASDRSGDILSEGWIRRIPLDDELGEQLKTVPPIQQAALLTQAGIWYDALHSTTQQRCLQPEEATLTQQWTDLLTAVELAGLVDEPLLFACPAE